MKVIRLKILLSMDLPLSLLLLIIATTAEKCRTSNDEEGECKSLDTCPKLLDALSSKTEETVDFVRNSTCAGTAQDHLVCCGSSEIFNKTQPVESDSVNDKKNLLPDRTLCGFQHSDDYVHTVNYNTINEFPWLALIKVRMVLGTDGIFKEEYRCSGSVINYRYVLTAAWCKTRTYFYPISVRLGEYNIKNNTDCILDGDMYECSNDVQEYGIEKYIVHPDHFPSNDIGLIRLNRTIKYTDYIRPLCLSFPDVKKAVTGNTLKINQWEFLRTLHGGDIKTSAEVQIIKEEQCKYYNNKAMFCVGPKEDKKDRFCSPGNVGSPALFFYKNQWQLVGILVEISHCFPYDDRIALLNVTYYLDWIINNLEP